MKTKVLVAILAAILIPVIACAGTVTLTIIPSTDDATIAYYAIEENDIELTQTCDPGCTEIILNNRADGIYTYRVGAVRENTVGRVVAWSNQVQGVVECDLPEMPDASELGTPIVTCP